MINNTKIRVAKKYEDKISYIDVEGFGKEKQYIVTLEEGYIFENMECGTLVAETVSEVLYCIRNEIVKEEIETEKSEMVLIEEKELPKKDCIIKRFECLGYKIEEIEYKDGFKSVNVNKINYSNDYQPSIHVKEDIMGLKLKSIEIQTTSYGALEPTEIEKIVKGYENALVVAKILEERYFR